MRKERNMVKINKTIIDAKVKQLPASEVNVKMKARFSGLNLKM